MGQILLFIIAVVIMMVVFVLLVSRREAGKYETSASEEFVGICKSAVETASQKETRKQKALGVSSRTAVRYLDELEKEGKVEQVGSIGHAVTYRLR